MPLLNDVARCHGQRPHPSGLPLDQLCARRNHCARYVERNQGGERTPQFSYLCDLSKTAGDMYIPVEESK